MAQKLQKEGGNRRDLEERLPFSPELLEKLKASQELRQLIEELQGDQPSTASEDSSGNEDGIDPFAPLSLSTDSSKKETRNSDSVAGTTQPKQPIAPSKSPSANPSGRTGPTLQPGVQANTNDTASSSATVAGNSSSTDKIANRNETTPGSLADTKTSNQGVRNQSGQNFDQLSRNNDTRSQSNQSRSFQPEGQSRKEPRSGRTPNKSGLNESIPSMNRSQSESALEMFQRKLNELGLGKVLEELTKEAIGIEQNSSSSPSDPSLVKKTPSRAASNKFEFNPSTQTPRPPPQVQRSTIPQADAPASTRSSQSESIASSPFESPRLSLPKLPSLDRRFVLAGTLLIIALIAVYFYLLESRKRTFQHRKEDSPKNNAAHVNVFGDATNRQEYIFLFHRMMERLFPRAEDWWTHRTVITEGFANHPQLAQEMILASEVYERARYMPKEIELPSVELSHASRAIQKCLLMNTSHT
jgi:hypothetical protein